MSRSDPRPRLGVVSTGRRIVASRGPRAVNRIARGDGGAFRRLGVRWAFAFAMTVVSALTSASVANAQSDGDVGGGLVSGTLSADLEIASIGDVITYTLTIRDSSELQLGALGEPFRIHATLPDSFRAVGGSATALRVEENGERTPIDATLDGVTSVILGGAPGDGLEPVPFRMGRDQTLVVRWQAVVGSDTRTAQSYATRVEARSAFDEEEAIAPQWRVDTHVRVDAEFERSIVAGRVFCDSDQDGRQQVGESGLFGARVYLDTGYYVDTDAHGLFHFVDVEAGLHLVKLDVATLPVGSAMVSDERRAVQLSAGSTAVVNFAVSCSEHRVTEIEVVPGDSTLADAERRRRARFFDLSADLTLDGFEIDGVAFDFPELRLVADDAHGLDEPYVRAASQFDEIALRFVTSLDVARWAVVVTRAADGAPITAFGGDGPPPERWVWDGREPVGGPVLPQGDYELRFHVLGDAAVHAMATPVRLRVTGASSDLAPVLQDEGDFFMGSELTTALQMRLDGLVEDAGIVGGTETVSVRVTVGVWDQDRDVLRLSEDRGRLVAAYLTQRLGVGADRVHVEPTREITDEDGVTIALLDGAPLPVAAPVAEERVYAAQLRVGDRALRVRDDGGVEASLRRPVDGLVVLSHERADGSRGTVIVGLPGHGEPPRVGPARLPLVSAAVDVSARHVTLGSERANLDGLQMSIVPEHHAALVARGGLAEPLGLILDDVPQDAVSWRIVVESSHGEQVFEASGSGAPGRRFRWTGATVGERRLESGMYVVRLGVRRDGGGVAWSAPASLELIDDASTLEDALAMGGGGDTDVRSRSEARIGSQAVALVNGAGQAQVQALSGALVWFEVEHEGAYIAVPMRVPDGYEAVTDRDARWPPLLLADEVAPESHGGSQTPALDVDRPRDDSGPTRPRDEAPRDTPPPSDTDSDTDDDNPFRPLSRGDTEVLVASVGAPVIRPAVGISPQIGGGEVMARSALGEFLAEDFARALEPPDSSTLRLANAPAGQISVQLPPEGATLRSETLAVWGETDPENRVFVNGIEAPVTEGRFAISVPLASTTDRILIETRDTDGNVGRIDWPVEVASSRVFLLAFGDSAIGTQGASLPGQNADNTLDSNALVYGQARVYFKGWFRGDQILGGAFDEIAVTAHVDTGRRTEVESFLRDTIDPERSYPVFGDASEVVADVNARGKVYVLIEADDSHAIFGNFNTDIRGIELLRYERAMYGAQIVLDHDIGPRVESEVRTHVSDLGDGASRATNFLRGTGGSIYYLDRRPVVRGSERVSLVVRDRVSGIELYRAEQTRHVDYEIRYSEGRIITKSPIPSVVDDAYAIGGFGTTRSTLSGHPVYLEVAFDHLGVGVGELGYGAHVRETLFDVVRLGGGVVSERRANEPAYQLWGVELGVGPTETTRFDVEYARSESDSGEARYSDDGGLTHRRLRRDTNVPQEGSAIFARARFEVADVVRSERERIFGVEAYYGQRDRGFVSDGGALDQGEERSGIETRWNMNEHHTLRVRHDNVRSQVDDLESPFEDAFTGIGYRATGVQYGYHFEPADVVVGYSRVRDDDERREQETYLTDIITLGLSYRIIPALRFGVDQEVIARGEDPRLIRGVDQETGQRVEDRFITGLSLGLKLTDDLELTATERFRYSGENSATVGMRAAVDDESTIYVSQRMTSYRDNHGMAATTVFGGEQRHGADGSGRSYGEYHVDAGMGTERTRAVMGFGKRWEVVRGMYVDAGYEHSQTLAGESTDSLATRDAVSVGYEFVRARNLKLSGLMELRFDRGSLINPADGLCLGDDITGNPAFCRDRGTAVGDRRQVVIIQRAVWKVSSALTTAARVGLVATENRTLRVLEARNAEVVLGAAVRPLQTDHLTLLTRYAFLDDVAPYQLELDARRQRTSHVFGIGPVIELPANLQLVSRVAVRQAATRIEGLPRVDNRLLLLTQRVNYHLTRRWDVGVEYRFLHQTLTDAWLRGALVDVTYIVADHVRLGVGFNFSRFAEDELGDFDRDARGVFFRVGAQY